MKLITYGFLVLSLLTTGCFKGHQEEALLTYHGILKDDVKTWDPASAYDEISVDLVPNVFETLYQYKYLSEEFQLEPLLATQMPVYSKDRLTVKIPIRHGIYFQDDPCFKATQGKGREVKAQDFIYGIKRLALPSLQSQGWWTVDGKIVGMSAFHKKLTNAKKEDRPKIFEEPIEGLKAIDDYTLQIKLTKPYPALAYILVMTFTSPVAREAIEAYADENGNVMDHPVGTGAFKLLSWERNHEIVLEKNPNYHEDHYPNQASPFFRSRGYLRDAGKKLPFLERLSFQVIKEDQPRWLNFMKGKVDSTLIPKDNFGQAITEDKKLRPELGVKGVQLMTESGVTIRYVTFNVADPILGANKLLRQALSSSIDREEWISVFTNNTGVKMGGLVPFGVADRPKTSTIKYDFDLKRAKELLAKAGYPDGKGLPVLRFDLRGASTTDRQIGEFFSNQFEQIGVKVEVIPNTFPAFLEKWKHGDLQISYGGWIMDYPDAENIYQLLYGSNKSPGPGDANFDSLEYNKLYEKMAVLSPGLARSRLIQKLDDIAQEECPLALGYYEARYDLAHPWVENYRPSLMLANKYKYFKVNKKVKEKALQN